MLPCIDGFDGIVGRRTNNRREKMKRPILNSVFLAALIALIFPAVSRAGAELDAIANLLAGKSGIMTIDFSAVSGEVCLLEKGTKNNMIHFSSKPESTPEDIHYFISPDTFKEAGLNVRKLAPMPTKLGKMTPLKWYYYDGKSKEPHHGKKLHRDFLVMAIDVK